MEGLLLTSLSGFYTVRGDDGARYVCKARGRFRREGETPLPGDRVTFSPAVDDDSEGVVQSILPRRNRLARPPVANVDRLVIVSAFENPAPDLLALDRLTAVAVEQGIDPVPVFNKGDLGDFGDLPARYRQAGFAAFAVSARTGAGLDELRRALTGVCVFTGNSGVGKSSLLNALFPDLDLATGAVSEKLGRGRHTTRQVTLYELPQGGFVGDTPGFSTLDLTDGVAVEPENLAFDFPEFDPFLGRCRFVSCTHTGEMGCAVAEAVERGEIARSRFENYGTLYRESAKTPAWARKKLPPR